jgi:hypothetical protein
VPRLRDVAHGHSANLSGTSSADLDAVQALAGRIDLLVDAGERPAVSPRRLSTRPARRRCSAGAIAAADIDACCQWTMMAKRQSVRQERAALVGPIAGRTRLDAERSLDELGGLAEAAGAKVVLKASGAILPPISRAGKIVTLAALRRNQRRRRRVRRGADVGAAAPDRGGDRPEDHRPHAAHP